MSNQDISIFQIDSFMKEYDIAGPETKSAIVFQTISGNKVEEMYEFYVDPLLEGDLISAYIILECDGDMSQSRIKRLIEGAPLVAVKVSLESLNSIDIKKSFRYVLFAKRTVMLSGLGMWL